MSKIAKNEIAGLRHFLPQRHFLEFFGRFLNGLLEVPVCVLGGYCASLASHGRCLNPKSLKNIGFFEFF